MAVQEFFKSIEKQYDIKLRSGFQNNQQQYDTKPANNNNISTSYPDIKSYSSLPQQHLPLPQTPPIIPSIFFFTPHLEN
jgi:hypothetical protein